MTLTLLLACASAPDSGSETLDDTGASSLPCGSVSAEGWTEDSHAKGIDGQHELVFPTESVPRVDLVICAEDFAAMQAELEDMYGDQGGGGGGGGGGGPGGGPEFGDPSYVPATVWFDGRSWPQVGIRYKGNSSLMLGYLDGIGKLPFRLDFDHYEDEVPEVLDQRFWGYKELKFSSGYEDDSLIKERVASETFREAGVPAARGGFMEVYVDVGEGPVYWGVYTAFEDPSGELLDGWFGDDSGNAYKPDGEPARLTYFDAAGFEKKTNEDQDDFSDVEGLIDALNGSTSDAEAWREGLEARFDVDGFLRYLALNNLIENWDSYGNMTHNYYLYGDPAEDGRLVWIPWDFNMSYGWAEHSPPLTLGMDEVGDDWPLIRHLADDPVYLARYQEHMSELLEGPFSIEGQQARMQHYHDLIEPYALAEEASHTALSSTQAFEDSLTGSEEALFPHVEARHAAAEAYLAD
jgi:spore coat protein H